MIKIYEHFFIGLLFFCISGNIIAAENKFFGFVEDMKNAFLDSGRGSDEGLNQTLKTIQSIVTAQAQLIVDLRQDLTATTSQTNNQERALQALSRKSQQWTESFDSRIQKMETKLDAMDKRIDNLVDRLNHIVTQKQQNRSNLKRLRLKSCALLSAAGGIMLFALYAASIHNPTIKDTIYSFISSIMPRLSIMTDRE